MSSSICYYVMLCSFCHISYYWKLFTETATKSDSNPINSDYFSTEGHTIPLSTHLLLIASHNLTPGKWQNMWRFYWVNFYIEIFFFGQTLKFMTFPLQIEIQLFMFRWKTYNISLASSWNVTPMISRLSFTLRVPGSHFGRGTDFRNSCISCKMTISACILRAWKLSCISMKTSCNSCIFRQKVSCIFPSNRL